MSGTNIKNLENYISYCALKNKVISKNIANIGTEDYQRQDVSFKNVLNNNIAAPMKMTQSRHLSDSPLTQSSEILVDKNTDEFTGINNVDVDMEMAEMAENTIRFKFAARKLSSYYKNLQSVIKGGGNA